MQLKNTSERYGPIAQLMHWLIVGLIIYQFVLVSIFEDLPKGAEKIETILLHKSVGMLILILALLRLIWRWSNPTPEVPTGQKQYERWLAAITHVSLYGLIIVIPLSGWLMSSLSGYSVSFFGWFDFPLLSSANKDMAHTIKEVHEALAILMVLLVILHVLAALKHHFISKNDVLRRMLPRIRD